MQPISITAPIGQAWERMVRILFQPFDIKKWALLGFCAFLATLGSGGGNSGNGGSRNSNSSMPDFEGEILPWIQEHIVLIVVIGLALTLVIVALMALVSWLQARGTFMFLDGITRNRGAVKEPWRNYRELGNSLFVVKFVLGLVMVVGIMTISMGMLAMMWPVISTGADIAGSVGIILLFILVVFVLAVVGGIIGFVISDLIIPTMYANDAKFWLAWDLVKEGMLPDNVGTIFVYALFKMVLGIGVALVGLLALVLTCCLAALPYVGSVILLPLSVFMWSYNLYFVRQFGERVDVFRHEDEAFGEASGDDDPDGGDELLGPAGGEDPLPYDNL
jgi:hypothetical protein